ncbi:MAG TPA: SRPBCC domain-containing protein, partial [Gemmatimonadaceae bacterium]|nr:SRPBCC domain-containing protein [Gemmatimonadaceae bacterium]
MSASAGKTMTDELMIVREIDAPIALVWKAWTDPEIMKLWSAPKGFTIRENQGELRPGGEWRSTMHTPEGKDLQLGGEYREIREPNRLVFT